MNKAYFEAPGITYLWKYTYVSGDGSGAGGTWEDRSSNLPTINSQRGYCMVLAVKPDNENHVVFGGSNLWFSNDGLSTNGSSRLIGGYESLNSFGQYINHHPDQHSATFLPSDPKVMISGHDGGVSRTEDITANQVIGLFLIKDILLLNFIICPLMHLVLKKICLLGDCRTTALLR